MLKTEQFKSPMYRLMNPHWSLTYNKKFIRERSDLIVECLTQDQRTTGSGLTGGIAAVVSLSKAHQSLLSTVLNQEDQPDMTQRMLTATKKINLKKQNSFNTYATED